MTIMWDKYGTGLNSILRMLTIYIGMLNSNIEDADSYDEDADRC